MSNVMERYITLRQAFLEESLLLVPDWFPLPPVWEGFRPTMKGFGAGLAWLDVGKVFILLLRSSLEERLSTPCS